LKCLDGAGVPFWFCDTVCPVIALSSKEGVRCLGTLHSYLAKVDFCVRIDEGEGSVTNKAILYHSVFFVEFA